MIKTFEVVACECSYLLKKKIRYFIMKKKIKKKLYTRREAERLISMLESTDLEQIKLAKSIIKNSKTYKHYHFLGKELFINYYGIFPFLLFVNKYSH